MAANLEKKIISM